jgi:K+-sensing histidine kinase KdpD
LFFEGLSSTPLPQQAYTVALSIRNCATVAEVAMFIYAVRTDAPHSLCGIFGFIVSFIDFVFFFVFFYYTFAPAKKKTLYAALAQFKERKKELRRPPLRVPLSYN